jgi:hypothetical protein
MAIYGYLTFQWRFYKTHGSSLCVPKPAAVPRQWLHETGITTSRRYRGKENRTPTAGKNPAMAMMTPEPLHLFRLAKSEITAGGP